jgi:hypothetical protein
MKMENINCIVENNNGGTQSRNTKVNPNSTRIP